METDNTKESSITVETKAGIGSSTTCFSELTEEQILTRDDDMISSVIAYRYKVLERIGSGGMSTVYRARHLLLNRDVALKLILPERVHSRVALKRFMHEAQSAMVLSHPKIASMREFGEHDGMPYLVMDFVEGTTLAQRLQTGFRPSQTWILKMAIQICEGLEHAHGNHIVHRDLKPANLIVVPEMKGGESIKIIDFGLAKRLQNDAPKLTIEGEVFGTPMYMSPEQCYGDDIDERADIYSLGCILYELIEGWPPFQGERTAGILLAHIHNVLPPMTSVEVVDSLKSIVTKCLAKDKALRYRSAQDLRQDLELVRDGKTPVFDVEDEVQTTAVSAPLNDSASTSIEAVPEPPEVTAVKRLRYHALGVAGLSFTWLFSTVGLINPWLDENRSPNYWLVLILLAMGASSLYVSLWGEKGGRILLRHVILLIKNTWTVFGAAVVFWLFFRQS